MYALAEWTELRARNGASGYRRVWFLTVLSGLWKKNELLHDCLGCDKVPPNH